MYFDQKPIEWWGLRIHFIFLIKHYFTLFDPICGTAHLSIMTWLGIPLILIFIHCQILQQQRPSTLWVIIYLGIDMLLYEWTIITEKISKDPFLSSNRSRAIAGIQENDQQLISWSNISSANLCASTVWSWFKIRVEVHPALEVIKKSFKVREQQALLHRLRSVEELKKLCLVEHSLRASDDIKCISNFNPYLEQRPHEGRTKDLRDFSMRHSLLMFICDHPPGTFGLLFNFLPFRVSKTYWILISERVPVYFEPW